MLCLDKMNGLIKRTSGKGLSDMANENGKSSSSKSRMYEVNSGGEQENSISNIPLIKLADNAQLLPKYTAGTYCFFTCISFMFCKILCFIFKVNETESIFVTSN